MATSRHRVLALALSVASGAGLWNAAGCRAANPAADAQGSARPAVTFRHEPNVLHIEVGGRPFADYRYADPQIPRPYFTHVMTPAGSRVTRNHPPDQVNDLTDHATMHPGIWMAFGDLSGNDYWRLKAKVEHERFTSSPEGGAGMGRFAVRNYYLKAASTDRIASEEVSYTILAIREGYLLVWDSTFAPYGEMEAIVFGDQEEMGLGIRVQTRLAEQFGGGITDAAGRTGAKEIWGTQSDWIDYSGTLEGKWIGLTVMPHPANFRKSWYHARAYGFIAANPFGRAAMKAGPKSEVVVKRGDTLRLRYGVLVHSADSKQQTNIAAAYQQYLGAAGAP
ncbi:MAG: hypothetical protein GEU99_21135 [Luteitalea sp.]|nr:hypothetical protein [Luteitalea sp.]